MSLIMPQGLFVAFTRERPTLALVMGGRAYPESMHVGGHVFTMISNCLGHSFGWAYDVQLVQGLYWARDDASARVLDWLRASGLKYVRCYEDEGGGDVVISFGPPPAKLRPDVAACMMGVAMYSSSDAAVPYGIAVPLDLMMLADLSRLAEEHKL